jgi:hypothetical protein
MINVVFSYDCEGNWGFVDREDTVLDSSLSGALGDAYRYLLDLHLSDNIPATFAFVGFYALAPEARAEYLSAHADSLRGRAKYLTRSGGCWEGAANFATIQGGAQNSSLIDVGSHSLTHMPFDLLNAEEQRHELSASKKLLTDLSGRAPKAFIYPRNILRGPSECGRHYRTFRNTPVPTGVRRLTDRARLSVGLFPLLERQYSDQVFWRGGSWRMVPDFGWKRMWLKRLKMAEAQNDSVQTVHVWSHPHNLVTDAGQKDRMQWLFELFEANRKYINFLKLADVGPDGRELSATP